MQDLINAINDSERPEGKPLDFRYDLPGKQHHLSVSLLDEDVTMVEYDEGSPVAFDGAPLSDEDELHRFVTAVAEILLEGGVLVEQYKRFG